MSKLNYQVDYKPEKEKSLSELSEKMGLKIKLPCSGKGKCGKCKVKIVSGEVNPPTKEEEKLLKKKEIEEGVRLACCVVPVGDVTFTD